MPSALKTSVCRVSTNEISRVNIITQKRFQVIADNISEFVEIKNDDLHPSKTSALQSNVIWQRVYSALSTGNKHRSNKESMMMMRRMCEESKSLTSHRP